jgi:ABC-type branched-subunit amino acid transport system ATPase component/ABC-type branched-subunit amino acid transport system permease subunit
MKQAEVIGQSPEKPMGGILANLRGVCLNKSVQRYTKICLILLVLGLPFMVPNPYLLRLAVMTLIYFLISLGYNAVITTAGMFHFGFIAYYALGAYTGALLTLNLHLSFWLVLPLSVLVTVVLTLLMGIPTLRFRGDYLCIVTLAFAEIIRLLLNNWISLTNGPLGLPGISPPQIFAYTFAGPQPFYYMTVILVLGVLFLVNRIYRSQIGLIWSAMRQNEEAVEACGINTFYYKQLVFAFGAALASIAGVVFAHFQTMVDPSISVLNETVLVLTMVILGGGSMVGLFISTLVLTLLPELLRSLVLYRMLVLGLFFIAMMNLRPEGFTSGIFRHFMPNRRDGETSPTLFLEKFRDAIKGGQPGDVLLEVKQVTKKFGGLLALEDVNFSLKAGEILAIIGPNGAGKTTMFNCITQTYSPTSGKVMFRERSITGLPGHLVARKGIVRTFQNIKLFGKMTVLDNVMLTQNKGVVSESKDLFFWAQSRTVRAEQVQFAMDMLEFVGLKEKWDNLAGDLPYAAQRRLEIARALAMRPSILLVDEPSAGMNPQEALQLMALMRKIRESGITIIIIEHNMRVVMGISDRIIVLNYGRKIAEGSPEEIRHNEEVIKAYLGEKQDVA